MFYPFYLDRSFLIIIPGLIFAIAAQIAISRTYAAFSRVESARGVRAEVFVSAMLKQNGVSGIEITHIKGTLNDHYDPKRGVIRLSDGIYGKTSIAAIAVAAHEAGHALQKAKGYLPMKLRTAIAPAVSVVSTLAFPLILIGIIMSFQPLVRIGCIAFFCIFIFQLVTLPVEVNASSRALSNIQASGVLAEDEFYGAKKVLRAAAMTYVASTLMAFLQFARLTAISRR